MTTNQVIDSVLQKCASMIQKFNCAIVGTQGYELSKRENQYSACRTGTYMHINVSTKCMYMYMHEQISRFHINMYDVYT